MLTEKEIKDLKPGTKVVHSIIGSGYVEIDFDPLSEIVWIKWNGDIAQISCVQGYHLQAPGWEHITVVDEDETLELDLDKKEVVDNATTQEVEVPASNQGRDTCYWCSRKTVKRPGLLFEVYDYCEECKK